jgi:ABC-type multidrug transport system fused ATPase/permease subunit
MWLAPKFILAATYIVYVLYGGILTAPKAFSIMSLYGYIQFYLQFLPNSVSISIESFNAIRRIQAFLLAEEINTSCITYDRFDLPSREYKPNSIEMENGNFYWDKEGQAGADPREAELDLVDVNVSIKKGEMVAIMGDIGSGKTSLLYALLG